ncbi:hypothetical protein KGF45_13740 [Clostridioides sp. ZZV14-6154]|uniref:hypothetical protein n=1 Tax=unclassified Clostridioides TaxID=2635829 RepID=UPI001D102A28|nr:hypothetical protein [Clostridioides sp. ZZV15-6388]MCC0661338.1 hypothetical protein [Clostridioides sp. ZZV14-6154]MCC0669846.1 hypothetical protein [Clostridioides sp. ZZV14-6153]MCC0728459.1 hypothetical protein [Clostridioides sp. ZZV14-6045]MCC0732723.1 hypothetical protein [Clostridioides sp. ZZV14-6048]MCC0736208.1 hypothetical protein [Clostridioides sp. ZZV14-6009]MCC0740777.1 hypothetical protein [Clostridioides sp. ZZV14-5902]WLD26822.1 hypothetical protein CDIFMA2_06940 [Clos
MGKFDDFNIDLRENKNDALVDSKAVPPSTWGCVITTVQISIQVCTNIYCGGSDSCNCNMTKISICGKKK